MAVGADVFTNGMLRITSSASDGSNILNLIASDVNGNVGVGTTSPLAKLDIALGSGTAGIAVRSSSTSATYLNFTDNTPTSIGSFSRGGTSNNDIVLNTFGHFDITGGNVGIGSTNPASKLSVNGGVSVGSYAGTTAPSNGLIVSGTVGIGVTDTIRKLEVAGIVRSSSSGVFEMTDGSAFHNIGITNSIIGGSSGNDLAIVAASAKNIRFYSSSTEYMRMQSDGNVGIGTTAPESIVHILGTTDPNMVLIDSVGTVASNITGRRANGTPGTKTGVVTNDNLLVVGGNGYTSAGSYTSNFPARINLQAAGTWSGTSTPSQLTFSTTPSSSTTIAERMRIQADGNVGVGITAPLYQLHLSGNNGSGDNRIRIANNTAVSTTNTSGLDLAVNSSTTERSAFLLSASFNTTTDASRNSLVTFQAANAGTFGTAMAINGANVGIGTTAPTKLLELGGATPVLSMNGSTSSRLMYNNTGVSAPNNSTAPVGEKITLWGDGLSTKYAIGVENSNIWFQTDAGFKWYEDTTVRMILSGGNVGIGGQTTSDRIVTVRSDTGAVASNQGTLALMTATDTNRRLELGRDYTNNLGFIQAVTHGTGYVPLILQYNGGNVGLGAMTAPATKLDIIGGINLQTSTEYSASATGSRIVSTPNLHLDSADGATAIYLNYFGGASGINFCNGSASCPASVSAAGAITGGTINGTSYQVSSTTVLGIGTYTNLYANGGGYIQLLTQASGHIGYMGQATFRTYAPIYPGVYPSGGDQASWPLYGHSSFGLFTTTGMGITGTLYMGGNTTSTVLNTNQLYCANASPCYFNITGTGATYLGNAGGTIAYLNAQSTLGTCNSVGGSGAYAYLYDCSSTPSDYAEAYGTPGGSEPGDIMVLSDQAHILKFSNSPYQDLILGVVSTDPNDFLGQTIEKSRNPQPIGLAGRLPVKVSLENGPIKKGDLLTTSSTPGVAMKATQAGPTIGMALEDYDGSVRVSPETLLQEHNRTTDHPDLPEYHSDPSKWPSGVGKISFLARVQYANPQQYLANLIIDDEGELTGSTLGNIEKITMTQDLSVKGIITASDFALDASKLNSTGTLASVPASPENKVSIADAVNAIDTKVSYLENKQASQSAELAQARILGEQAVAQAESLDDKVASTSANLASLSAQINSLLGISQNEDLELTPPSAIASTESATVSDLEVTNSLSTLSLEATDATVSATFKSLGETFLGNTAIAGDLSIDGTFSVSENTLNALPTLYLQRNALAEKIDIFNGLITLDKTGLLKAQKLAISDQSLGSIIIPAGETSVTVSTTSLTDKSKVFVTTEKPVSIGANSKNTESHTFKVEISSPQTEDLSVDWWIVDSE
jgi:hypothetical protein